jgi:hypothetical protein
MHKTEHLFPFSDIERQYKHRFEAKIHDVFLPFSCYINYFLHLCRSFGNT